jgi:hypothetical protein
VSRYLYRAERDIAAPAARVWEILADLERYAEWNPFTPYVETDGVAGRDVIVWVDFALTWPPRERGAQRRQRETVRRFAPGEVLVWSAKLGAPWLFYGERWQEVEALGEDRCRYVTHEQFRGPLAWLVDLLYGARVQRGFEAVADALARHAERAA